jgi:predicted nuclease of predicted toxin-antitoxin system
VRLLLDEHYSFAIAEQLQQRGIDAISVAEHVAASAAELRGTPDEELLRWARQQGRVLVTENVRDFMPIHRRFLERGESHAGIIFTPPRRFPRHSGAFGLLVKALAEHALSTDTPDLEGDVAWL